jgi:hypothetical protein
MPDIYFSSDAYQKAIDKIASLDREVGTWRTTTASAVASQKDERARLKARMEVLVEERDAQRNIVDVINKKRLKQESAKWFGPGKFSVQQQCRDQADLDRRSRRQDQASYAIAPILLLPPCHPYSLRCGVRPQAHSAHARYGCSGLLYPLRVQQCESPLQPHPCPKLILAVLRSKSRRLHLLLHRE